MKLIFRADDLGFSEGINYGICKSVTDGVISSVGMMPNMEYAQMGYELIKDKKICLGQHTNICVGKPLCNPQLIPSLIDEEGKFCSSKEIRARKEDTIVVEEAELEIQAQLERFCDITGRKPEYFEGHAVFSKNFFTALKNVAERNHLFYVDPVDTAWSEKYGIKCSSFYKLDKNGLYDPKKYIFENEAGLNNENCYVLVFHPGFLDQYILDHSSFTLIRPMETAFLCSDELKKWIKENQIEIVDFTNYRED